MSQALGSQVRDSGFNAMSFVKSLNGFKKDVLRF